METPKIALITGALLILTGVLAWMITDQMTAIIPAPFGFLLSMTGYISVKKPSLTKHMMHAAAGLTLLGVLMTAPGLYNLIVMLFGGVVDRPLAAYVQSIMAVFCIVFLYFAVRSFINARKSAA